MIEQFMVIFGYLLALAGVFVVVVGATYVLFPEMREEIISDWKR